MSLRDYLFYEEPGITLYCGDCREVLPLLEPESITMLWTDPPYGHGNQNGDLQSARVGVRGGRQRAAVAIVNDTAETMRSAVDEALRLLVPLLRRDCCCCCCGGGGPSPTFAWLADRMDRDGLSFFHAIVWDKTARGHGLGWRFRRDYEMIMIGHRSGGRLAWANEDVAVSNILRSRPEPNDDHPTTKPIAMVGQFIGWHTATDDLVIDPFLGGGTTLQAAKNLGRRAIGIEIEAKYCDIAVKRLRQETLPL